MKVHGEGLADGSKSSNSDSDESELDLDDELDGDDLDDDVLSRKASSDNNRLTSIGRRSNGKQKRASLNSDGAEEDDDEEDEDDEEDDEDDDEEDDDLADAEDENSMKGLNGVKIELKREYSPEQNGDGKRAYTRRNVQRGLGGAPKAVGVRKPKKKLLMADNEASPIASVQQTLTPGKRGRKPRQVHLQDVQPAAEAVKPEQLAVGHRQAVQTAAENSTGGPQINPLALSGAAGTPTYYPLGNYAASRGHYGSSGSSNNNGSNQVSSNYASPSSQAQCNLTVAPPATDQYGRHHYSASQINQDSSSSPSTTTAAAAAATATSNSSAAPTTERQTSLSGSMGQQGQHHQQQQHQHGSQQLSSPAGGQTNGSSPQATLSEW